MKITGGNEIANYVNRSGYGELKKASDKTEKGENHHLEQKEGAVVDLSQKSLDFQKAQAAIHTEPDIRVEKVNAIKERIKNGEYEIDYGKTAEKVLQSFADDLV